MICTKLDKTEHICIDCGNIYYDTLKKNKTKKCYFCQKHSILRCTKCENEINGLVIGFNRPYEFKKTLLCIDCCKNCTKNSNEQTFIFMDAFTYWLLINEHLITESKISNDQSDKNRNTSSDQTPNP